MLCVTLPESALCKHSLHRAILCFESLCRIPRRTGAVDSVLWYAMLYSASLCQTLLCVALPDSALCKHSLHHAMLCLSRTVRYRAELARLTVCSRMTCYALHRSARLRAVQAVCIVLYYGLGRSARHRAELPVARSAVCSGMPCYALRRPDRHRAVQTPSTVRSAMLCSALCCRTSPRTGAVGSCTSL